MNLSLKMGDLVGNLRVAHRTVQQFLHVNGRVDKVSERQSMITVPVRHPRKHRAVKKAVESNPSGLPAEYIVEDGYADGFLRYQVLTAEQVDELIASGAFDKAAS